MSNWVTPAGQRRWQRAFIRGLGKDVLRDILAKVENMPTDWDGHELREFMAEAFDRERTSLMKKGPRARKYRRDKAGF